MPARARTDRRALHVLLFLLLLGLCVQGGAWLRDAAAIDRGILRDADSYTHLLRAEALWDRHAGELVRLSRLDAPAGLSQHWTRPFDLTLLAPARLLQALGHRDSRTALYWAGVVICPVLHILAALAAAWAARAIWPFPGDAVAGALVLLNPVVLGYSAPGQADHHTLLLLLGLLATGHALRAITGQDPPRASLQAMFAGALAGLGTWVNPEGLLTLAPLLAAFALAWCAVTPDPRRMALRGLAASLGAGAVLILAIGVEHPVAALLAVEYDRVSVAHLALVGAAGMAFAAALLASPRLPRPGDRLAAGAALILLLGLPLAMAFPGLLGVSGGFDAGSERYFVPFVAEMQPVPLGGAAAAWAVPFYLGPGLAGLLALALALPEWRRRGLWPAALLLAALLAASLLAAIVHRRAALDLAGAGSVAAAGLGLVLASRLSPGGRMVQVSAALAGLVLAFAPTLAALTPAAAGTAGAARCTGDRLGPWLAEHRPAMTPTDPAPIVLANLFDIAPQLAYATPYRFVASPYHRGGDAFADTVAFFGATDDAEALGVLDRRAAGVVLVCRTASDPPGAVPPESLLARLRAGDVPDWLSPVALPPDLAREFLLFTRR